MQLIKIITIGCLLLSCYAGHTQKPRLELKLIDTAASSYKEFIFEVVVTNGSRRNFVIQDTSFLQERMFDPIYNLLTPEFYKKRYDEYAFFDAVPRSGVRIPEIDSCLEFCCNCITVKKNESLKFKVKLLVGCEMEKGQYKVLLNLIQPMAAVKNRRKVPLVSNEVFFQVH